MMPCDGSLPTPYDSITALIQRKASRLARRWEFRQESPDDLRQELWCHLLKRVTADQATALPQAHLARTLKQIISKLVRHRRAQKRQVFGNGNDTLLSRSTKRLRLMAVDAADQLQAHDRVPTSQMDLAIDITTVLNGLRDDLRELALELQQETVAEVARRRCLPPSSVYESVRKIRRHFHRAGFSSSRKQKPSSRAQTG